MRYKKYLRIARALTLSGAIPDKQHIVVCFAFEGRKLKTVRLNTETEHAEMRALQAAPNVDRLVVYRFNRADAQRSDRPSCPCFQCCPKIRDSRVTKVEFLSPLGPVVVKVDSLEPYNGKD